MHYPPTNIADMCREMVRTFADQYQGKDATMPEAIASNTIQMLLQTNADPKALEACTYRVLDILAAFQAAVARWHHETLDPTTYTAGRDQA